jgi:hypothetical protein
MSSISKIGLILSLLLLPAICFGSVSDELRSAAEKGQVAFLLVTDKTATDIDQARSIIQSAMQQVGNSVMIEMDRSDVMNSELVAKYRLSSAPLPLILVFASNGIVAGGNQASKLNTQRIIDMIPSPKETVILEALQSGKAVLVTASRKGMKSESKVFSCCASASGQMKGKCQTIEIDMDDKVETDLLKKLRINTQSQEPVTVVINAQGQVTGSFDGPVDVGQLVSAATKKASSCCPSGSGKSCAPAPKKGK